MTIFAGIFMYFGALLVPLLYFAITGWSGTIKRRMMLGVGLQFFWSLMVWVFVWFSWKAGYSEYYWGWGLLIPVNAIGFLWFVGCMFFPQKNRPEHKTKTMSSATSTHSSGDGKPRSD